MRHLYADFIDKVAKPMRYLGGEYGSVIKEGPEVAARVCLAFPDVYDIGMSHLGTKIIYSLLNKDPRIACERAFAPWTDMEAELRERNLPLVSLETQRTLAEFDVIGISLQYELTYTNVLTLLDLGGIALHAKDRDERAPLVLAGGPVATHAEPMAPFFDAFFIGDADNQGQVLAISRVGQPEDKEGCPVGYVDALANKNPNELAREVADTIAADFICGKDTAEYHGTRGPRAGDPMIYHGDDQQQ